MHIILSNPVQQLLIVVNCTFWQFQEDIREDKIYNLGIMENVSDSMGRKTISFDASWKFCKVEFL